MPAPLPKKPKTKRAAAGPAPIKKEGLKCPACKKDMMPSYDMTGALTGFMCLGCGVPYNIKGNAGRI